MRKFIISTLLLYLVFINIACSTNNINKNLNSVHAKKGSNQGLVNSVSYKDGTFIGEGDLKSYGREIATITIYKGQITEVAFKRFDSSGNELLSKNNKEINPDSTRRHLLKEDINTNVDLLISDVLKKQSYDISIPTQDKDLLLNWKFAVKMALEKAKK